MSDPSRPVAPFLPPEIISKILESVHQKKTDWNKPCHWSKRGFEYPEFAQISRISAAWRAEGQRRLFEVIEIWTTKRLVQVVEALKSGLGFYTVSLTIQISQDNLPTPSALESHQLYLLLKSIPNLEYLSFSYAKLPRFNSKDRRDLKSSFQLPKLTTIEMWICQGAHFVMDPIITAASNLQQLEIGAGDYDGPMWSSKLSSSLRVLHLSGQASCILEGDIWPLWILSDLESLEISGVGLPSGFETSENLFSVIGSSLRKLVIHSIYPIPPETWSSLSMLESLEISRQLIDELSALPLSLTQLDLDELEEADDLGAFMNLRTLTLQDHVDFYDFNNLPPLDSIIISESSNTELILECLLNFLTGRIQIGYSDLGKFL